MSIPYGSIGTIRVEGFIGNEDELAEKILKFLKENSLSLMKSTSTKPKSPPPKPYKPLHGREPLPSERE